MKSPPELWAEISDVTALARHLGEFGEIRITRLEPETTVAWEGDTARGTVELQASGWGTKVTLTAELVEAEATAEAEPVAAEAVAAEAVAVEPVAAEPAPEPPAVPAPEAAVCTDAGPTGLDAHTSPEPERACEPESAPAPAEAAPKLGFFARLFGRKPRPEAVAVAEPEPVAVAEPEPVAVAEPEPVAVAEPEPEPEPVAAAPEPEPAAEPERANPMDAAAAEAVLAAVLDDLGSAHHRPFSRS